MENELLFQDYVEEIRPSAHYAYIGSILFGNAFLILAFIWPSISSLLYSLSLIFFFLPLLAFLIGTWKPEVGFWVFAIGLILIIFYIDKQLNIPGFLHLLILPSLLTFIFLDPKSALVTNSVISALLIINFIFFLSNQSIFLLSLTLFFIWAVILLILHIYMSNYRFFRWTTDYYIATRESILDARKNNEKFEQMMENLSYANNLLLRAHERAEKLRWVAEEAKNAKTKFVANVSHEFRTPLNMIIGLVELIVESPQVYKIRLPETLENDLRVVLRNCQHLSEMINDILDLTRLESGQVSLHKEMVNLTEIMEEATLVIQPLIKKKDLHLKITYPEVSPIVYCDKTRIRQVILNLMSNAARFTDHGTIHGEIICHEGNVEIQVVDTGPGIPADELKIVFEPFLQGTSDPWRAQEGSGLGLSISKKFVELHGGQMSVRSEVGKGSTFKFSLPLNSGFDLEDSPTSKIVPDWVWREDRFKAAVVDHSSQKVKPCVFTCDREGYLAPLLEGINSDVEYIQIEETTLLSDELNKKVTHAVLCISPQTDDLLQTLTQLKKQVKEIPIIGISYAPTGSHLLAQNIKYLIKPVTLNTLTKVLNEFGNPISNILIVDDNHDFLQLMNKFLLNYNPNLRVSQATNGVEALDRIKNCKPEVILLDIVMETMDGWQLLEIIKHDPELENIPVIIISAQDPYEWPQTTSCLITTISGGIPLKKCIDWLELLPSILVTPD